MSDTAFNLCFDKDFSELLTATELIYVSFCVEEYIDNNTECVDTGGFICSSAYEKLFEYYADEMPYGVAKCIDSEPDYWILNKITERL